jgi:hypothetical protein
MCVCIRKRYHDVGHGRACVYVCMRMATYRVYGDYGKSFQSKSEMNYACFHISLTHFSLKALTDKPSFSQGSYTEHSPKTLCHHQAPPLPKPEPNATIDLAFALLAMYLRQLGSCLLFKTLEFRVCVTWPCLKATCCYTHRYRSGFLPSRHTASPRLVTWSIE